MLQDALPERLGLLLFCALVALFGGGVRAALRRDPSVSPMKDVVLQASASAFCGFLAASACLEWVGADRVYLTIVVTGIAGWAGASALDVTTNGALSWLNRLLAKLDGKKTDPASVRPGVDEIDQRATDQDAPE